MTNAALAEMFRYNRWANLELFGACRTLSDETLDARAEGVSGNVRELLLHVAGGQQTQILRTMGRQHEGELTRTSAWRLDALVEAVRTSSDELLRIAEDLDADAEVDLPFMGKVYRYPKRFFLAHAVTHGIEHRTEVKVALAQLGVATPDLDGWPYAAASGYGREVT